MDVVECIHEKGLDYLKNELYIMFNYHGDYPLSVVSLNYNQTRSDFSNPLVQQCRGLILDVSDEKKIKILNYPYVKFFSFGETCCEGWTSSTDISSDEYRVYEKYDGSIVYLYFYDNKWHVSSSSIPDGSNPMGFSKIENFNEKKRELRDEIISFRDLFWDIFTSNGNLLPSDTRYCYMFEMLTPRHPLIVQHSEEKVILHGARNLTTLHEADPYLFSHEFKHVATCIKKQFGFKTIADVLANAQQLNPVQNEGYVVCRVNSGAVNFDRVKVKNAQYVQLSTMLYDSRANRQREFLNIVKTNENSEYLAYFPQYHNELDKLRNIHQKLILFLNETYSTLRRECGENQKMFVQRVMQIGKEVNAPKVLLSMFYEMKKQKDYVIEDGLKDMNIKYYEQLMNWAQEQFKISNT